MDPAAGEPAVETAVATLDLKSVIGNWGFSFMRVTGGDTGFGIDEVRIGTTWAAVTPTGAEVGEGYAGWAEENFGADASNSAIAGPDADPDGDGIQNLVEYSLGLDPLVAGVDGLPVHGTVQHEGQTYLTLTFSRPTGLTDVAYDVDASGDVIAWPTSAVEFSSQASGGIETVTYRDVEPLSGADRRFLRLRVSQQ